MRFLKAFLLTTWLYSLLVWLYIVDRIIFSRVSLSDRFISWIPYFTFFRLGVISFVLSFVCLFIYLVKWGVPGEGKSV